MTFFGFKKCNLEKDHIQYERQEIYRYDDDNGSLKGR